MRYKGIYLYVKGFWHVSTARDNRFVGIRNNLIFIYTCAIESLCVLCLRILTTRTGF